MAGGGGDAALIGGGGGSSSSAPTKAKTIPLNEKVGLQFPIGKTSRLLEEANYAPKFDATAPIYLAAVLEYLSAEVLEFAGNAAIDNNLTRVESQHLDIAVKNDDEFIKMLENMNSATSLAHCGGADDKDDSCDFYSSDEDSEDDDCSFASDDYELHLDGEESEEEPHEEESAPVTVGQMSIAAGRVELYKRLVDQFGEIVVPDISNFKVEHTCLALNGLLNLVASITEITPTEVTEEVVSGWEDMASFYSGIGLRIDWFFERIHRYNDWLEKCKNSANIAPLARKLVTKGIQLEAKRKEVSSLEKEFQALSTKIGKAKPSQNQLDFSFLDV